MGTIGSKGAHGIVAARDTGMQLVVDINQQCLLIFAILDSPCC